MWPLQRWAGALSRLEGLGMCLRKRLPSFLLPAEERAPVRGVGAGSRLSPGALTEALGALVGPSGERGYTDPLRAVF